MQISDKRLPTFLVAALILLQAFATHASGSIVKKTGSVFATLSKQLLRPHQVIRGVPER